MTPLPKQLEELFAAYAHTNLSFRKAEMKDASWLLSLRNDPETRKQSISQQKIAPDEHQVWLKSTLNNPSRLLFIASLHGEDVASFRLDQRADGSIELSWTVAPTFRGKGIGKLLLSTIGTILPNYLELYACVLQGNPASIKLAQKAGLSLYRQEDKLIWLKREPSPVSNDA